jgi:DNA-binding transcriptional MocR family regulator
MGANGVYGEHVERLAAAIADGRLKAGSRLPAQRDYADEHGIAPATVARIYRELEQRGLTVGETGRGTFVRAPESQRAADFSHRFPRDADTIDLEFNYPVLPEQASQLRQALRELANQGDLMSLLSYQPYPGRTEDREIAADWLARSEPDAPPPSWHEVLMCAGSQHALSVLLMALAQPRDVIAVEALTYPGFKSAAHLLGIPLLAIDMDDNGLIPAALEAACRDHGSRLRMVYTMPTLQNPTGIVMPLARRQALVDVARRHDLWLIDDSVYGFLIDTPPPRLRSLAPERVIEIHSVSKSGAPGLRAGFIVAPERARARLEDGLRATLWTTSPLTIALVSRWMQDGTLDDWIRQKRVMARQRQTLARTLLNDWPITGNRQGFHLVLTLPEHWRADDFVLALSRERVAVTPLSAFCAEPGAAPRAIRIALAAPSDMARLEAGLMIIKQAL